MCAGPGCVPAVLDSVGSQQPASLLSSGVAPEDQGLYVCEARNVFGKAQAEALLVVTGHGLWVLWKLREAGGRYSSQAVGTPGELLVATTLDQCIPAIVSLLLGPYLTGHLT